MGDAIERPVEVARELTRGGLPLKSAHAALQRLAEGEPVTLQLAGGEADDVLERLGHLGLTVRERRTPRVVPKHIRERFGLSQREFALRFGLKERTVQNWEQARYELDAPAKILLSIIERNPDVVEEALTTLSDQPSFSSTTSRAAAGRSNTKEASRSARK